MNIMIKVRNILLIQICVHWNPSYLGSWDQDVPVSLKLPVTLKAAKLNY